MITVAVFFFDPLVVALEVSIKRAAVTPGYFGTTEYKVVAQVL